MRGKSAVCLFILAVMLGVGYAPNARADEESQLDKYLDKYWGEKRDVTVIQKRLFAKDGRHEFGLYSGLIPNDDFFLYFPVGLRYNWFVSEDLSIELFGAYMFQTTSELEDFLNDEFHIKTTTPQVLQWTAGLEGVWSPVHGKIQFFTTKLFHFDFHFAIGAGVMGTKVRTREEGGQEEAKFDVAGNAGAGVRMYLTDSLALRVEYRHFFYPAEGGGVSFPAELTLGIAYFLR